MRKFLLALPLAAFLTLAGCEQSSENSSSGMTSPRGGGATVAAPAPQVQQPAPPSTAASRHTTTQPLPAGNTYIHDRDLTGGPLASGTETGRAAPQPSANGGGM